MARKKIKIKLSEVFKKDLKLVGYLLASGLGGWVLSNYVLKNQDLVVLVAPAINYILFRISKELEKEGYRAALAKK